MKSLRHMKQRSLGREAAQSDLAPRDQGSSGGDDRVHPREISRSSVAGQVRIGSEDHKQLFCRMLIDTSIAYEPANIDWPHLSDAELWRLRSLPIWDISVQTERKARLRVLSYAQTIADPLLRLATELNAFEEGRHKAVLATMVAKYGIVLSQEPAYSRPRDPEWAFMVTGFSECVDSFFAFGLFEAAKRSGYFPPALVDAFEPVIQEEARHILFFVNWVAWHRRNQSWWRKPIFAAKVLSVWVFLIWERLQTARDVGGGNNFTATGHASIGTDLSTTDLLVLCLSENQRRLAVYDDRLLRPTVMPLIARFATRIAALMNRGRNIARKGLAA